MILKALFGNNKDQASPQQQQQAPPFVFSPDNEIFQFGELVTAESLIENSTENSPLLKLILWFKEHPGTAEFVSFRNFMQENIPNFSEIKRVSIKEQILKGIDLIIRQEKVISDPTHKQPQSIERPFPNLIGIKESNLLWRKIQLNDIIIDVINQKLNLIINKSLKAYKIKASSIVSLLTSVDAFPSNYIPIVNYKGLDLNNEMVINKDPEGCILQQQILALQQDNMVYYKNMNKIEDRFSMIESINPQPALFYKMLEQYLPFFNEKGKFLEGDVDTNPFLDFLNHPRCDALASFQNYISKCQEKTFSNFVESMFLIFEISQPQMRLLLVALSSYALAPIHIPMLDHNGNMNEKNIDYSFQFFIETDPLKFLNLIYEKAQEDQSEDSLGKVMQQIIEGFSGFANNWVDIFRYVVFFSIPEFLPSHLQQVRNEIEKCIQLYN